MPHKILALLSVLFLFPADIIAAPSNQPGVIFFLDFRDDTIRNEHNQFQGHWVYDGKFQKLHLLSFAQNGNVHAIKEAAKRYLSGDGLEKNMGAAWYWLKRAEQVGEDISTIAPKPLNQLLTSMNEAERETLAYLAHYHDDLDLSDITIPPSFAPLTREIPAPLSNQEIVAFAEKFKVPIKKNDKDAYQAVERELFDRTVGIRHLAFVAIHGQIRPFGMDDKEFVQRKCNYIRAIAKIFPHDKELPGTYLQRREIALASLYTHSNARYVDDIFQTGQSCPNSESAGMAKALAWAKSLARMTAAELRALADEHLRKSGSISRGLYEPGPNVKTSKDEYERVMHLVLSKRILGLADDKELQQ